MLFPNSNAARTGRRKIGWTLFLAIVFSASAIGADEPPSAYGLLADLRQHYAALADYGDRGSLEHCRGEVCRNYVFETVSQADGAFLWRLRDAEQPDDERVVWSDGRSTQVYDRRLDQRKDIASPTVELAHGLGEGGYDAFVVAGLLAGDAAALDDPEGASVDGPLACPEGAGVSEPCWLLSLFRLAGSLESTLWVGVESRTIYGVETLFSPLTLGSGPSRETRLTVVHRPQGRDSLQAEFEAPDSSRRVERFEGQPTARTGAQGSAGQSATPQASAVFIDEVTVELFSLPVRIFDSFGEPLRDLKPEDLKADIGGRSVPVSHLDWVGTEPSGQKGSQKKAAEQDELAATDASSVAAAEAEAWADWYWEGKASQRGPQPRVIVIFVQADFEPSRVRGHLRLLPLVQDLIQTLEPTDRLALVTFDSHLRLWQDLTTDHQLVAETLFDAIKPGGKPNPEDNRGRGPFLRPTLDVVLARDVANAETALGMTAKALIPIDGRKEVIFLGWGLGEYRGGTVQMTSDFRRAVDDLFEARATVSVLDATEADWHALEFGLKAVARATGGTYQRTLHFASQATKRLSRQLQGYYLVYLDRQAAPKAKGTVHVKLRRGPGRVVHPNIVVGRQ